MKYILGIVCITPCCFAGLIGTELKTEDDIKYIRCLLEAKIEVAKIIRDKNKVYKCDEWIKQAKYKDSIYNVITTAIADCALGRKEFAKEKIKNGIVTFENKDYKNYTDANWNALVLYNFINYLWPKTGNPSSINAYWVDHAGDFYENVIQSGQLKKACGDGYAQKIGDAYKDIVEYNKNLQLWSSMCHIHFISDENLRQEAPDYSGIAKVVYDVGKGQYRRIRYDFSTVPLASAGSTVYENKYLTIEIANEQLERILAYGKDGVNAIELNDHMEIEKAKNVFDPNKDDGTTTKNLKDALTDIDPSLLIVWHESDDGIHINKIKYDRRMDDMNMNGLINANFKNYRKIKITASNKYNPQANYKHNQREAKPIIFEKECFKGDVEKEHRGADCEIDLEIIANNKDVILPDDCTGLFTNNSMIRSISLLVSEYHGETIKNLCNDCQRLETITIQIKSATNLKDISYMVSNNPVLESADIKIEGDTQIKNINGLFMYDESLKTVRLDITPSPNDKIDMKNMFWKTQNLKSIIWGQCNWIKQKEQDQDYARDIFALTSGFYWTTKGLNKWEIISDQLENPIIPEHIIVDDELYKALKQKREIPPKIDNCNQKIEEKKATLKHAPGRSAQNEMIEKTKEEIMRLERDIQKYKARYEELDKTMIDAYNKGYI